MTAANQSTGIRGIIPPMITPLLSQDKLDHEGLEKLISHLIEGGVHGIFILGTTGELPSLNQKLRQEFVEKVCKLVNNRIPVLVGITDTSFEESIRLAEAGYKNGATALVLAPPYYYPLTQIEMLDYFEKIARNVSLPLFLYNIPFSPGPTIHVETVAEAAQLPGIAGIKDSSGDKEYFQQLMKSLKLVSDFSIFTGSEEMMAEAIISGAAGGIVGGANAFPSLYVALYNSARQKDHEKISQLQEKIQYIRNTFYQVGDVTPNSIRVIKGILSCLGICNDMMAQPFQPLSDHELSQIKKYIQEMGGQL